MPHDRRVHWPDDIPARHRLTRENLDRVPIFDPLADNGYRRPGDRLTLANLNQVPVAGFYPDNWSWGAAWDPRDPRRYRRGSGRRW